MAFGDKLKSMIADVRSRMIDDEGLFQGGKYGRVGGRFKDWMDSTVQDQSGRSGRKLTSMFGQQDVGPGGVTDLTSNMFEEGDPRLTKDFEMARTGAFDFDPSDPNDVLMIQKRLNRLLPEGSKLEEDSMFGPKTESALRMVQNQMGRDGKPSGLMQYIQDQPYSSILPGFMQGDDDSPAIGSATGSAIDSAIDSYSDPDALSFAQDAMTSMGFPNFAKNMTQAIDASGGIDATGQPVDARGQGVNATGSGAGKAIDIVNMMKNAPWMKKISDISGY